MFKSGLGSPRPVQTRRQEQQAGQEARRQSAHSCAADGRAEFRKMFVSLVDPAGLLDTEKCGRTAALMEEAASRAGYEAGARMSRLLAGIFEDLGHIADMPVEDGVLDHTSIAARYMMEALFDTAEAYREGGDAEPIGELEEARNRIARLRSEADLRREEVRAAGGPPGAALPAADKMYVGKSCRRVARKDVEEVRADRIRRGIDPIFAPKPRMLEEFLGDADDPNLSSADWLDIIRGKGPPEGYEMVRVDDGDERQG